MNENKEDPRLVRMEEKVDSIQSSISSIDITLAKQSVLLEEHTRRSTNLEERMIPIEDHVKFINKLIKLMIVISGIGGTILAFLKYLR